MSKLTDALYGFQRNDVARFVELPRGINGNPMGAGKTIEALAIAEQLNARHVLVVCKKTYIGEWFRQTCEWSDGDTLTPHENSQYEHRLSGLNLADPHYVVVNYDLLLNHMSLDDLKKVPWDILIVDECHKIKNHEARRTRAAYMLSYPIPRTLLMSGTPLQRNPLDLFPLFHIINPRNYHNWRWWRDTFCVVEKEEMWLKGYDGKPRQRLITKIVPGTNNEEQLNQLLHLYMVRHEKSEIFTHLPPKTYRVVPVTLGHEMSQYKQMEDEYLAILDSGELITAPKAIAQMTRLRQICCDPNLMSPTGPYMSSGSNKTTALLDLIEDSGDDKLVVFSVFARYVKLLSDELNAHDVKHVVITGGETPTETSRAEQSFQHDDSVKVALGTVGAMGECFTLTAGKKVVFMDRPWNSTDSDQCEDRVWGRVDRGLDVEDKVEVIDLFNTGTVEEHVLAIRRSKEKMIEAVVTERVVDRLRKERT